MSDRPLERDEHGSAARCGSAQMQGSHRKRRPGHLRYQSTVGGDQRHVPPLAQRQIKAIVHRMVELVRQGSRARSQLPERHELTEHAGNLLGDTYILPLTKLIAVK